MTPNPRRFLIRLTALGLGLLGGACQQEIPQSQFDAHKADQTVRNLTFTNVSINRSLDPKLLIPPSEPYILGPGDVLDIELAEIPGTLARTFVMPDGMVYYNLAGGIRAEGLVQAEFAKRLTEALKRDYANPLVNVSLVEVRSRRYWILGRVFKPGIFPLRQPTTLLEAISESGGLFTSRFSGTTQELADLSSSIVIRDGDILPVNFDKLIKAGDTSQNIYLRNNDLIYLPSAAASTVLLLGAVAAPQAVGYRDSLTLVDCIAQGKGPAEGAYLKQIVIVRGTLDKPSAAVVNLQAILTGKESNVRLQPGDIVWIPRRPVGLLETVVKLAFKDAARSIAASSGSRVGGNQQDPVLTIPLGQP
jgi:protein involved in polysaccharide export with SLBB domain